ncbi:MAG: M23 family metallopeptidase [Sphingomonas sp.]|uniref:M23 family metallopeptidase n=1 Tax=Sphingomonas sp. TaxID=28214 RepID=UPI0017D77943|nr:M23 family metallopeptidase [Sphingomonas sp.]
MSRAAIVPDAARVAGISLMLMIALGSGVALAGRSAEQSAKAPPQAPKLPARAQPIRHDFTLTGPMVQGGAIIGAAPTGTTALTLDGALVPMSDDGRFLIAFDRDAPPTAMLVATMPGGMVTRALVIAPRAWNIERLDTLPRFAQPTEEFNRRRPQELAAINAARSVNAISNGWRQRFQWPVIGRLSGMFGAQRIYKNGEAGSYHSGTDVARPTGTPVVAPADGVVILAADSPFTLEGNLLMLDHGMGLNSSFLHLSRIDVHVGEHITQGEQIGAVGMTGRATGPHLHWSLKWRDRRIDPLLIAGPMPAAR